MNISVLDVETGTVVPGVPGTPTVFAATGLVATASQAFNNIQGPNQATVPGKGHHHE